MIEVRSKSEKLRSKILIKITKKVNKTKQNPVNDFGQLIGFVSSPLLNIYNSKI